MQAQVSGCLSPTPYNTRMIWPWQMTAVATNYWTV